MQELTLSQIRKQQYSLNSSLAPYLDDWKRSPYTFFKSRLYTEASSLFVFFLLKTDIMPNAITIAYGVLGVLGGILLAIAKKETILTAVFIFFFKGILDWSDGHYARMKGRTSLTGAVLDPYGSYLGALCFQIGLGLYVAQKGAMAWLYYAIPLIPFFYAANAATFGYLVLYQNHITHDTLKKYKKEALQPQQPSANNAAGALSNQKFMKLYSFVENFLDNRARTVDFICLLLVLETYGWLFITPAVFLVLIIKRFLMFAASFYIVARGGWVEKKLVSKLSEISQGCFC